MLLDIDKIKHLDESHKVIYQFKEVNSDYEEERNEGEKKVKYKFDVLMSTVKSTSYNNHHIVCVLNSSILSKRY